MAKIQNNLFDFDGYAMITRQIGRVKDQEPHPEIVDVFRNQLEKLKPHNVIKLEYLVKNRMGIWRI